MSVVFEGDHEMRDELAPAMTIDVCALTCSMLELTIAKELRALAPGDVLEVRSDRTEAGDGIRAWVGLAGHTLMAVEKDPSSNLSTYFIRKKTREMRS
jgi:TusA-related sulfurtransferase